MDWSTDYTILTSGFLLITENWRNHITLLDNEGKYAKQILQLYKEHKNRIFCLILDSTIRFVNRSKINLDHFNIDRMNDKLKFEDKRD